MTYREAIERIRAVEIASRAPNAGGFELRPITVALQMAVSALEKQIPHQPEFTDEYYDDAYCECGFEFEAGTTTWNYKYCPMCGQALDWGWEENGGQKDS